jgi:MraZ protein
MFHGSCPTRLDEKGRLKIPADFKKEIDKSYDGQFYITSLDGKVIKLYPLKEWELFEHQIKAKSVPYQIKERFLNQASLYGQVVELDAQGRLTIAERLRNKFGLKDEVGVVGKLDHMEIRVWDEYVSQVEANPLTPEELDELMRPRN